MVLKDYYPLVLSELDVSPEDFLNESIRNSDIMRAKHRTDIESSLIIFRVGDI